MTLNAHEQQSHERNRRSSLEDPKPEEYHAKSKNDSTDERNEIKSKTPFLVVLFRAILFLVSFTALHVSTRAYAVIVRFLNERRRTTLYRYTSFSKSNNNNNNNNNNNAESIFRSDMNKRFLWTIREVVLLSDMKHTNNEIVKENGDEKKWNRLLRTTKKLHAYFAVSLCEIMLNALGHSEIVVEGETTAVSRAYCTPLVVVSNAPRISELIFFVKHLRSIPLFITASTPTLIMSEKTTLEANIIEAIGTEKIFLGKTCAHRMLFIRRMKKLLSFISGRLPTIYFPEVSRHENLTHVVEFDEDLFAQGQKVQPVTVHFLNTRDKRSAPLWYSFVLTKLLPKRIESLTELFLSENPLKVTFLPPMEPSTEGNENLKAFSERVALRCAEALDVPLVNSQEIRRSTRTDGYINTPFAS